MSDDTQQARRAAAMEAARGRLGDRGHDPSTVLGQTDDGSDVTLLGFYSMLGTVAATEKAGQDPTYAMARLALHAGLASEVADALYLAYNQQSAEEAGHGDKVFGNAYFAMGGAPPRAAASAVGDGAPAMLRGYEDAEPEQNRATLVNLAAFVGGIETVALKRIFPRVMLRCEQWGHRIGKDLAAQVEQIVRPEESRHVLIWRYVFHTLVAPRGDDAIAAFKTTTTMGRGQIGGAALDPGELDRLLGSESPTLRQLMGKDRVAFAEL